MYLCVSFNQSSCLVNQVFQQENVEEYVSLKMLGFQSTNRLCVSCSLRLEREASFAQKNAERATVRSHFREKYRLPKVSSVT